MDSRYLERIGRAAEATAEAELDGLLVTPSADLIYLAGYDPPALERLTCLIVRPGQDPMLFAPDLEVPRARSSPVGNEVEVIGWSDGRDPYESMAGVLGAGRYGVADRMWAIHILGLQEAASVEMVPASGVLGPLRAVKDQHELGLLSRAARAADESFRRATELRMEGLREEQVAAELASFLLESGHESVAFTIVGSGPNGASPHHEPGDRPIRDGDPIVLDFGGRVGGYCSDISRTVAVTSASQEFLEVHEIVREAQEAAFQAVSPGVPAEEVDAEARAVIERAGYGERFLHRTGHGIGLEEHEGPYIVTGNREPLRAGMCFSIEPGIYLEGRFGVRIEDIVAVTEQGAQRLNRATREPVTVS